MLPIVVSMRVETHEETAAQRDVMDRSWANFLSACGLTALYVPNNLRQAQQMVASGLLKRLLLTDGNALIKCEGDAPERDQVERFLLNTALQARLPVMGVGRGMQVLQDHWDVALQKLEKHVMTRQIIQVDGQTEMVNSQHHWGATDSVAELPVWAKATDGVVKGIRHDRLPVMGLMWHPQRQDPYHQRDIRLFRKLFHD